MAENPRENVHSAMSLLVNSACFLQGNRLLDDAVLSVAGGVAENALQKLSAEMF
jgi:hypothetical protein